VKEARKAAKEARAERSIARKAYKKLLRKAPKSRKAAAPKPLAPTRATVGRAPKKVQPTAPKIIAAARGNMTKLKTDDVLSMIPTPAPSDSNSGRSAKRPDGAGSINSSGADN